MTVIISVLNRNNKRHIKNIATNKKFMLKHNYWRHVGHVDDRLNQLLIHPT